MTESGTEPLRLIAFAARDFRSLRDVRIGAFRDAGGTPIDDLPPIVLLYGENDTGKSNLIEAVGVWLRIVQALAWATPLGLRRRDLVGLDLYEQHEPDWSDERTPDAPDPDTILGSDPDALFRYGSARLELEGELLLTGAAGERRFRFGFRIELDDGRPHCTVLTAHWPSGRMDKPIPLDDDAKRLRGALRNVWQQVGAERHFTAERLPGTPGEIAEWPLDPTGANLKLRLFRAANGVDSQSRQLVREGFAPLLTGRPFDLPPPLPVISSQGELGLLVGDRPIEHRGSGPQQWALMAGLLTMSRAPAAGLEEPEAHLSLNAQARIAEVLRALITDPSRPPHQLFVSSHSDVMLDLRQGDQPFFETTITDGATRVERSQDIGRIFARFEKPRIEDVRCRRLLGANHVRLSDEAVRHLKARSGDKLFEEFRDDGSLGLITVAGMDDYFRRGTADKDADNDG
jgi:hypothetical protein